MDQGLLIATISAGSALVASVAAQLVGGWLNRKQLREELGWDRQKWIKEQQQVFARANYELKRQTFIQLLVDSSRIISAYEEYSLSRRGPSSGLAFDPDSVAKDVATVDLLSPEVVPFLVALKKHLMKIDPALLPQITNLSDWVKEANKLRDKLADVMQQSLLDPPDFAILSSNKQDPMNGTTKTN